MNTLYQILAIAAAGFIIFIMYRTVKNKPELFSRENISKSFGTMGILALILIAFVTFCIFLLRA